MKLLAIDPSGNHGREGMGTSGFCVMYDGVVKKLDDLKANNFSSEVEYWSAHARYIFEQKPDHIVMEGFKLYNHKGQSASKQANSELQTPQLIGVIKHICYINNIPLTIQFASDVKTRWSEDVLVRLVIIESKKTGRGTSYYFNGKLAISHHLDALKHALHWTRYKGGK